MVKYTIDQIINAGIKAYAKHGENFTMANVGEELGTNPSSIYRHVKNKRELYFAMLTREFEKFDAKISEFAKENPDPKSILKFTATLIYKIGRKDFELFKLMFISKPPPTDDNYIPGEFERNCKPQSIQKLLKTVGSINTAKDNVLLTYTLIAISLGEVIVTSDYYEGLNEGILPSKRYDEFHDFILEEVTNLLFDGN